jgi:hypothetical protein
MRMWVTINSDGKIFCRRIRYLGSNLAYTKTSWCIALMVKSYHHETDVRGSNFIVSIQKKKIVRNAY